MVGIEDLTQYKSREFCKDVRCRVQSELDKHKKGSEDYERVKEICKSSCINSAHEFHHWLQEKGYLIVKEE